ncbi:DUF6292 family protein [Amycolatopsis sp. FDAARGOS 1241]|uniref:DUF6292 family protein n=1 Tax=Amycolatopsis sp. FDAARGOS 1241 TaxID=2778070 RepID=UPI0019518F13|nr:DUF6292 family protein [Amycolatopsis sp. FDAARGOS 1241]QRP48818.1 hypothetical protein I6J71_13960 [Amycolatopsis sp. FDAARGOS 1241]
MTSFVDADLGVDHGFDRALRGYLARVAAAAGVGLESCTVDLDVPVSAYVALDRRLERFPDRDLALLWDEVHRWSAAIEASCGEDLIVLAYLEHDDVLAEPEAVARFLTALRDSDHSFGRPDPRKLRRAGNHEELLGRLA